MNIENTINHIKQSIENAKQGVSRLSLEILRIDGQSSAENRHLLNNITCIDHCRYLEIGSYKGSTLISALYENNIDKYWSIENWSGTSSGGAREEFFKNFRSILNKEPNIIEKDFISIDPRHEYKIENVNVYFYDGNHFPSAQQASLTHYYETLQNEFIFMVDDYCEDSVRRATEFIIKAYGFNILYDVKLGHKWGNGTWWNGLYVSLLQKTHLWNPGGNIDNNPNYDD